MSDPVTLAIDTARDRLQLALRMADGRTDTLIELVASGHAEIIMGAIESLLTRNGLAYSDLERVAVLSGPGSFTGLRIGLSVARGLALALAIPALGIPTLLARSLSFPDGAQLILDARRDQAYRQVFAAPGNAISPPELVALAPALAAAEKAVPDDPVVDIASMAGFAALANPAQFPPDPLYVRAADAKPQEKGRIALQ